MKGPPIRPFVAHKIGEKPWAVPLSSHERARIYWRESVATKFEDSRQAVSLHAWLLYTLRFIFTVELAVHWHHFGGLSAQLSHLSIVQHLSVTETAAYAIA